MTLKSISLIGFKSFGKKSVIDFTNSITSIVGPNGSGKSNIVEAIRFVLGEQSMKSLRGKGGTDLIFKGSRSLASSSRAQVQITFDNKDKIFSFTNSGLGVSLDYDEVIIAREVFADGVNKYSINNTEVRLKDIIDLLASVNIGSSGHHIISQGEADRVLNATNKERKSMIEDALGLKIYQFRIKESQRKLEKTISNIKEVQSLRREIAPHLAFLKKQVAIIEKVKEMRVELGILYKLYLSNEGFYIKNETNRLDLLKKDLKENEIAIDIKISDLQKNIKDSHTDSVYLNDILKLESILFEIRNNKNELIHKSGKLEGIIEGLEHQFSKIKEVKNKTIDQNELENFINNLSSKIDEAINKEGYENIVEALKNIKTYLNSFGLNEIINDNQDIPKEDNIEYIKLQNTKTDINNQIENLKNKEIEVSNNILELKRKEKDSEESSRNSEKILYELLKEKNEIVSNLHSLSFEEEKILVIKNSLEMELMEAGALIGREVTSFVNYQPDEVIDRNKIDELRRKIERIKIKIEDGGGVGGLDVVREYEETLERDLFLSKEIDDLNKSIKDCDLLINELKEKLETEFKVGIDKINKQFDEFFALMFGGGGANLSLTMEYKKPKKDDEIVATDLELIEESNFGEEELDFERGININVNLPHKKVKDLNMLSGGERSLTSIALLFAISQVNPPPFLVLDETDAALDEANSRKYGNMLENLSKYSQLIVVTHNRETMSRAQVLYGVTMGFEGSSKLLSIHLKDASLYAK